MRHDTYHYILYIVLYTVYCSFVNNFSMLFPYTHFQHDMWFGNAGNISGVTFMSYPKHKVPEESVYWSKWGCFLRRFACYVNSMVEMFDMMGKVLDDRWVVKVSDMAAVLRALLLGASPGAGTPTWRCCSRRRCWQRRTVKMRMRAPTVSPQKTCSRYLTSSNRTVLVCPTTISLIVFRTCFITPRFPCSSHTANRPSRS